MSASERMRRTGDWAALTAASKLPRRVRYWAAMVAIGRATHTGPYANANVIAMPLDEILKNLDGGPD